MTWIDLVNKQQLDDIKQSAKPVMLFKHSTRCSISVMAKDRLERYNMPCNIAIDCYYLDLLNYRELSNQITIEYEVMHESPQILIVKDGSCIYDASQMGITGTELNEQLLKL
jgi:bacillithiol system protein YtxJ